MNSKELQRTPMKTKVENGCKPSKIILLFTSILTSFRAIYGQSFLHINSKKLHGTPKNSKELRGTPWNSEELQFIINYLIIFKVIFTFYEYFEVFSMYFRAIYGQSFLQINSKKLHGTPWNSMELHGTPWNSMELRGTPIFIYF